MIATAKRESTSMMRKRPMMALTIVALVVGAASVLTARPVFAAANTAGLKSISLQGVGTGALAAGSCSLPAIACATVGKCECLTGAETILGNQGFNTGSLTFELSIDTTTSLLPISTAGSCFPATGFGSIKSSNGKVTLLIDVSGLACPTTEGAAEVFNGTYHVTGGSGGKNPFTTGTGAINGSLVGTVSRASINGNVQP
jgi:hypothetical protein